MCSQNRMNTKLKYNDGYKSVTLTVPTIKKNLILLPPLPEQQRMVAKIEELFAQLDSIGAALQAQLYCRHVLR